MDRLMRGMSARTNPKNGFRYIKLHYSADPARDEEWALRMKAKIGERDFAISHDIQRVQLGGIGVFSDLYSTELHEASEIISPHPRFGPVILGWDFGGNHSVAVIQRQGRHTVLLEEFPNMGFGTKDISKHIYDHLGEKWGHLGLSYIDAIDPAGKDAGKETDAKSCADILVANARLFGRTSSSVKAPKTNLIKPRLEAIRTLLRGDHSILLVNPTCPFFRRAMKGAYCWPEKLQKNRKAEPEKNDFSHLVDAFGYGAMIAERLTSVDIAHVQSSGGIYYE